MAEYVDTHAHIHAGFDDIDEVVARAQQAGLSRILTLGVTRADSEQAVALAHRSRIVRAAAGVHPHDAAEATDADLDALEALAGTDDVVLVGEIGLDYYRNLSPRDAQLRVFRRQLETAARAGKPVAVHSRDAHDDVFRELAAWSMRLGGRLPGGRPLGVLHYFSGDAELAGRYIELGYLVSIHTSVTHPRAEPLRDVVRRLGLGHVVIETDSPYGAPQRFRGKRNEPAYVIEAAEAIASVLDTAPETVASATTAAALRLLGD